MTIGKTFEKRQPHGGPKMTAKELAEEFGVSAQKLAGLLSKNGAPKAVLQHRTSVGMKTWFNPQEVRAWFKGLPK